MNKGVLIIDDCEPICKVLKGALELDDIPCETCYSGKRAESLLQNNIYSIVIIDVSLPDVDSLDLVTSIRQKSLVTSVFVISGNMNDVVFYNFMSLGVNDFFLKSRMRVTEIVDAVKNCQSRQKRWSGLFPEIE